MIYIVHGEDTPKSRALIVNQQKKLTTTSKINLDIKNLTPEQLYEHCISNSLFGESPLVVLDVTDYKKGNSDEFIDKLLTIPAETTVIVYSAKALTKSNPFIKRATELDAKISENNSFSDANVFKFVDALLEKNRVQAFRELNKLTQKGFDSFYIFSMILYGIRNVAKVVLHAPSEQKLNPFQATKTKSSAKKFTERSVKETFFYMYDLEKKAKTGGTSPELMLTLAIEKVLNSK